MIRETDDAPGSPRVHDTRGNTIDLSPLGTLLTRIQAKYHPDQIWLFGSRARGEAREGSDWDLLILVPDDIDDEEITIETTWELQRHSGVRADVIACRTSDFDLTRDTANTLAYEAAHSGIRIDERR